MRWNRRRIALALALGLLPACGVDPTDGGFDDGSGTTAPSSSTGTPTTTGATSTSDATGSGATTGSRADLGESKFDLGQPDGGSACAAGARLGETMYSYIWIANSTQDTVSKIDTRTGVEQGRYDSSPTAGMGNPSRTSVNLFGDVAVSNREPGGVTKIAADVSRCDDRDQSGTIETSSGPGDVRPWMQDECVLWHRPLPTEIYEYGARPTAWEGGDIGQDGCVLEANPRLWIGYKDEVTQRGIFLRLDGATGEILDEVEGPIWQGTSAMGPYGGGVNAAGDFIVIGLNYGNVLRIDAETLEVTEVDDVPIDKYGMALDAQGNLWVGGFDHQIHHYDFGTQTWTTLAGTGGTRVNGIVVDRNGYAWGAGSDPCRVVQVDVAAKAVVQNAIPLPGCDQPWGASVDVDGYVWIVDNGADRAFKIDPQSYAVELEVTGLVDPYTYSDMTGSGLNLVVDPPG